MGHRLNWILEQISALGVGGDVGAAFEKKKKKKTSVKGWRRYTAAKERSSRRNMVGMGTGQEIEGGPAFGDREGEVRGETRSLLRGKGPDTGEKEKDEENEGQARKWTWWR